MTTWEHVSHGQLSLIIWVFCLPFPLWLLLLFLPDPLPVAHTLDSRACLSPAYFEDPVWAFFPFLALAHLAAFSIRMPLWQHTFTAMMGCSPRLVGLTQTCQVPIFLIGGQVCIIVLNRKESIQGPLLRGSSTPQLVPSFTFPDPNKGQGHSLAREKNCIRKGLCQNLAVWFSVSAMAISFQHHNLKIYSADSVLCQGDRQRESWRQDRTFIRVDLFGSVSPSPPLRSLLTCCLCAPPFAHYRSPGCHLWTPPTLSCGTLLILN